MPTYFTQFSFAIPLKDDEQQNWAERLIAYFEQATRNNIILHKEDEFYSLLPEEPEYPNFRMEIDHDGLWFYAEESGMPGETIPILQAYLAKFEPEGYIGLEWADFCSKPVLDAFGGGAMFVTISDVTEMSSGNWIHQQIAKHEQRHNSMGEG